MSHGKLANLIVAPRSRFYQGNFGRLFPDLPGWSPANVPPQKWEEHFLEFANEHMVEFAKKDNAGKFVPVIPSDLSKKQNEDTSLDSDIPAGYTYFGQFIDHDVTLDATPLGQAEADPNRLHNFRTPRLDLDCVYGGGPAQSPYLYEHHETGAERGRMTGKMLVGKIADTEFGDLPRNAEGRALIGDMRNDENAIVAQIQLAFIKAHNELAETVAAKNPHFNGGEVFAEARRILQWLYQWIVWHDFINRITLNDIRECALRNATKKSCGDRKQLELGLKDIYNWKKQPFMPVEFSVSAYRFGHSMARASYQTNIVKGFGNFVPLFDVTRPRSNDLSGFGPLTTDRVVQWDWFLDMDSRGPFPQMARQMDTKLSNALMFLRENQGPDSATIAENKLPVLNLLRSVRMEMPSGTAVAKKLGIEPLKLENGEPDALWFYILREAAKQAEGNNLGQVGSYIVCSVFAGLLKGDGNSWVNRDPCWTPDDEPILAEHAKEWTSDSKGEWQLSSIIRMSGLPVNADDVNDRTANGNASA